eukprot:scaffold17724_cov129-Isochrysis_galbana.AAC.5
MCGTGCATADVRPDEKASGEERGQWRRVEVPAHVFSDTLADTRPRPPRAAAPRAARASIDGPCRALLQGGAQQIYPESIFSSWRWSARARRSPLAPAPPSARPELGRKKVGDRTAKRYKNKTNQKKTQEAHAARPHRSRVQDRQHDHRRTGVALLQEGNKVVLQVFQAQNEGATCAPTTAIIVENASSLVYVCW